jgi:hypothetical protein
MPHGSTHLLRGERQPGMHCTDGGAAGITQAGVPRRYVEGNRHATEQVCSIFSPTFVGGDPPGDTPMSAAVSLTARLPIL